MKTTIKDRREYTESDRNGIRVGGGGVEARKKKGQKEVEGEWMAKENTKEGTGNTQ